MFSGLVFIAIHYAMLYYGLDDPLDAVAVHCGGGTVGVLLVHFFSYGKGIFWMVKKSLK
jgi:ammonia channel protein AmtB